MLYLWMILSSVALFCMISSYHHLYNVKASDVLFPRYNHFDLVANWSIQIFLIG